MTEYEEQIIATICPAIQSKHVIRFWYQNFSSGLQDWRIAEPYAIGSFRKSYLQLSAWFLPTPEQILSGQKGDWRSYILKNISEVQILEKQFDHIRDVLDSSGSGMKEILCVHPAMDLRK